MKNISEEELNNAVGGQSLFDSTIVHKEPIIYKKKCPKCGQLIPENDYNCHLNNCK